MNSKSLYLIWTSLCRKNSNVLFNKITSARTRKQKNNTISRNGRHWIYTARKTDQIVNCLPLSLIQLPLYLNPFDSDEDILVIYLGLKVHQHYIHHYRLSVEKILNLYTQRNRKFKVLETANKIAHTSILPPSPYFCTTSFCIWQSSVFISIPIIFLSLQKK